MDHQLGVEPQLHPQTSDAQLSFTPDQPIFNEPLLPPSAPYLAPSEGTSTPRDSYINSVANSAAGSPDNSARLLGEKDLTLPSAFVAKTSKPLHKKPLLWALAAVAVALIATAVVVPVYFTVIKPKNNSVSGGNSNGNNPTASPTPTHTPPTGGISGGNGSTILAADGTEFTYLNPYGGICKFTRKFLPPFSADATSLGVSDPNDPFNDDAYPNSWTPPLNSSWTWGKDKLYGYVSSLHS